jgi:hypothetical protein
MLDGKTNFSKSTLQKMTLGELKTLVGNDKQKQKKEPVVVAKTSKPRRREPVLREFSDSEEEKDEQDEQKVEVVEKEEVVEPEKEAEKPVVEQRQRGRPSKNKIKTPKLSVEQASKEVTPPQSPQQKALTTSELRKVLRADYFKGYESDVKEILCEYKNNELTLNQVVQEYTLLRDDFLVKLNNFLDTQRKLSDVQLDYIDSLLQRVADRVESELN